MQILLTNDDGIYAPGLAALEHELKQLGEVCLVAPATEQSGVGHSITFLTPLICQEVFEGNEHRGWAVEGSPADCVKLGVSELCASRPRLVVSGINSGLNAGINVLYSGTVAAAIEGAFFGILSIAVSLEYDEHAHFEQAARMARSVIEQILSCQAAQPQLYNLNIPTAAVDRPRGVKVVPMDVNPSNERFIERKDPKGRTYYWAANETTPLTGEDETDQSALQQGFVTLTPLCYDMTKQNELRQMQNWELTLP